VKRKKKGETSSIRIQDLMPLSERMLSGVANLPKGALYRKLAGPAKVKIQKSHCLLADEKMDQEKGEWEGAYGGLPV
jgi:hypothetical protein